jgi:hypothetical protein
LVVAVERVVTEQTDEIVGHQDESQRRFGSPKVLETKRVEPEALLEFLDAVLTAASPCPVGSLAGCLARCARFTLRTAVVDVPNLI